MCELPCQHPEVHTYKILQWLVCSSQDKEAAAALKKWMVAGPVRTFEGFT